MDLKSTGRSIIEKVSAEDVMKKNTYALSLLQPLLQGKTYIPYTSSAINPFVLAFIVNDVIINQRNTILEFGSGISTIVLSRLFKMNNLSYKIISVDDNADWIAIIKNILEKEELEQYVEFVHAPLQKVTHKELGNMLWYSQKIVIKAIEAKKIDLLFVDGPIAMGEGNTYNRYTALPVVFPYLNENCSVYLDDTNRAGEQRIVKTWQQEFPLSFSTISGIISIATRGSKFNFYI